MQKSKSLWQFFLISTALAQKISISLDKAVETIEAWSENPLSYVSTIPLFDEDGHIALPLGHESISNNLKTVSHPTIHNVKLSGFPLDDDLDIKTLTNAIVLLKNADPLSFELFNNFCGAICFIRTIPERPIGECVSLTSKLIPGLIYMTPVPTILTTETIVHESAHLFLTAVERLQKLYESDDPILNTPLRPDPRPISGLMHQVWVLINLVRLYGGIQQLDNKLIDKNIVSIKKRANLHREQLIEGLAILKENKQFLTTDGKNFLKQIDIKSGELI
jgi:hypothetical protein